MTLFLAIPFLAAIASLSAAAVAMTEASTTTSLESIPIENKAIEPSCFTTVYPVSSTCYAGVHTLATSPVAPNKRDLVSTLSRVPANVKAIAPSCSTFFSTTSSCYAGVHPQPTFSKATVTTTITDGGSVKTSTTTTEAGLSVGSVSATAGTSGGYNFAISPELRSDILDLADSFCPGAKAKRDPALGPSCRLPSSSQAEFLAQFRALVAEQGVMEGVAVAGGTAAATVIGVMIFSQLNNGLPLGLSYNIPSRVAEEIATTTTTSSSSGIPPATLMPGPPNQSALGPESGEVAALTKYLEDFFQSSWPGAAVTVTTTSSFACTHGAAPNVFSGTAGYCMCGDGKTYPVSPVPRTTTVSGTRTTYNEDCPYTTIPSTTTDLGPTRGATITANPDLASTTSGPDPNIGLVTCYQGGASIKHKDMKSVVKKFCRTASKKKWTATHSAGGAPVSTYNANGFGSQMKYQVDSDPAGHDLYLEVKFTTDACEAGEEQYADFRNKKWCKKNFFEVIEHCETDGTLGQLGGSMKNSCVRWDIHAV